MRTLDRETIFQMNRTGDGKKWLWLAIVVFFSVPHLHAGNPDADGWVQQGLNALARGDYPAAVGLYQKAVASDPGEVNYLLGLSNAFIQAGQFADGQHALELGISNFSDPAKQAQLWAALADLHTAWARNVRRSYAYQEAIRQYLAAF